MELYNAVNESYYTNPDELEITTIEDVVYMGMRNDLSFIISPISTVHCILQRDGRTAGTTGIEVEQSFHWKRKGENSVIGMYGACAECELWAQ